jgi:lysophospholipase L1-like esterase
LHLLAGTNDIAGNTGEMTQAESLENIRSMIQQAQAQNIKVLLGAILPADAFHWRPTVRPLERILSLNKALQALAQTMGIPFIDYHSAMCDENGAMRADLADDGVHPNVHGYRIMEKVLSQFL